MESLEEFERIEQEMKDIEFILTGELPKTPEGSNQLEDAELLLFNTSKSAETKQQLNADDPDVLREFEDLETACDEITLIKIKATQQEMLLRQDENKDNLNELKLENTKPNDMLKDKQN